MRIAASVALTRCRKQRGIAWFCSAFDVVPRQAADVVFRGRAFGNIA